MKHQLWIAVLSAMTALFVVTGAVAQYATDNDGAVVEVDPVGQEDLGNGEEGPHTEKRFYPPKIEPYGERGDREEAAAAAESEEEQTTETPREQRERRMQDAQDEKSERVQEARENIGARIEGARERREAEFGVGDTFGKARRGGADTTARVLNAMRRETIRYKYRIARLQRMKQVMLEKKHYEVAKRLDAMLGFEAGLYRIRMRKLGRLDEKAVAQFEPSKYRVPAEDIPDPGRALAELGSDVEEPTEEIIGDLMTEEQMQSELKEADELDAEVLLDLDEDPDKPLTERSPEVDTGDAPAGGY